MTLLRDLIDIPTSVGEGDFVVKAAEGADLAQYVVTDQLRESFTQALGRVGHAVRTGRSQAMFLHGSFGSGKSHFMVMLREILRGNPQAREVRGLAGPVLDADSWLEGRRVLTLTFHMVDAKSVEQAVLEGYLNQIMALHPDAPVPAVHRSDAMLEDAARLRARMGEEAFFAALRDGGRVDDGAKGGPPSLAKLKAQAEGWTPDMYAAAAVAPPGTSARDSLVSALTGTFFTGSVRSGEYLDLDTGLAVLTRHAKSLGYDAAVLFLDEFILWLSGQISNYTFVNTEGAKLNKLVESADASRPMPLVSFVARQRNLEEFLGQQVGGTEREALAHVMRSAQGRLGEIVLADTNLPEITEKRLLKPRDDAARAVIDNAFAAVRSDREVWDTLLLGAQHGDAGIGSDATAFRKLYPFSPALVATLVALSQALQRERTALKVMTELLVERRDTLEVNDLIGVAALFDPLVLRGELPDRPTLKELFRSARILYTRKLRPILLALNEITEEQAAGHAQFTLDDKLIKTLLLGALVPEVPALHNLTAAKLHALNFGTITSPIPGYENQIVLNRLNKIANDAGELQLTESADPVVSIKLHAVDYDKLLDLVPNAETVAGVRQQLVRELVSTDMGLTATDGQLGEILQPREWRGRRHHVQVKFGNVRDPASMPVSALIASGDGWRIVIDYPFDPDDWPRSADRSRILELDRGSQTVFWLPLYLTNEMMTRVIQLAKINYLLGAGGTSDRLNTLAADWSPADRQQGKVYLQQRQAQLRNSLLGALRQAYGVATAQSADIQEDSIGVLHTLSDGLLLGDPRGGTLAEAFQNLTGEILGWSYPGRPALPEDEKPPTRTELNKILEYARQAAADPTRGVSVPATDQRLIRRICNNLHLGELVDHRYVLDTGTCHWSRHLLQLGAEDGFTERFPVGRLRELLDRPAPCGFDTDLQNLIISVFALEQQLAWYDNGGKLTVTTLAAVRDDLELRHPPMPGEQAWIETVQRGHALFGLVLPMWRTPANLGELAGGIRAAARQYAGPAGQLVEELTKRADLLGLDKGSASGRLATARRVARLLSDLAHETDDVVLVESAARADVGELDDQAAAVAFKQAPQVVAALARRDPWPLVQAVTGLASTQEQAKRVVDQLHAAARRDQHAADLARALHDAVEAAAALLATERPRPVDPPVPAGGALVKPNPVYAPPAGAQRREVGDASAWEAVAKEIAAEVAAGRHVTVTWEVR